MAVLEQTKRAHGSWYLDKVHSSASFEVNHNGISLFSGRFSDFDASLDLGDGEPELTGGVKVASIQISEEALYGHLQSPDFFDAERYPTIDFRSTAVRAGGDGIEIDGELTIKGHTEQVTATGKLAYVKADLAGAERYGVDLETTIDRTIYGVDWNQPLPNGEQAVANDVSLLVHVEFLKQEEA